MSISYLDLEVSQNPDGGRSEGTPLWVAIQCVGDIEDVRQEKETTLHRYNVVRYMIKSDDEKTMCRCKLDWGRIH